MRTPLDIENLLLQLRSGERGALSRAITLVESSHPQHRRAAQQLMRTLEVHTHSVSTQRIAFTGSPGAGKSTLIEVYGTQLVEEGKHVAVLAVDPSSNRTGGSILGDKTRMEKLSRHPSAYVRPSPAGTTLGGVARATREAILLCEAAGYTHILIETVGVGQSEHAVRDLCDLMVLLVMPGGGDDLQGIKRGIVELADLILVNKADGEREAMAQQTARDYRQALHVQAARSDAWIPLALPVSALAQQGMQRFRESVKTYFSTLAPAGIQQLRTQQNLRYFNRAWGGAVIDSLQANPQLSAAVDSFRQNISAGTQTAEAAIAELSMLLTQRFAQ